RWSPAARASRAESADHAHRVRRHVVVTDLRDLDHRTGVRRLDHGPVAQVERHVVDAALPPEQHVAAPGLGRRDLLAGGVLVAGVLRDRDPGPGEGVLHQPRAVEADVLVVAVLVAHAAVAHTQGRPVGVAAAPGVAHAELGHRPVDDGLDLLRIRGVGDLPADVAGDLAGLLLRGDLAGRVLGSGVLRSPAGGVLGGALGGLL